MSDSGTERGSGSGSSDGSSDGSRELDPETEALIDSAPLHAHIGEALRRHVSALPAEVCAVLSARGARVASSRLLKTSFHATFCAELSPPFAEAAAKFPRVIVQVLGAQLGDKPLFGALPLSAAGLARAAELAARAGVRVPRVLATGQCDTELGTLDFLVQEFIDTQTVEDKVCAPADQWHRVRGEVQRKLCGGLFAAQETDPLPRFESVASHLDHLLQLVPGWDAGLRAAVAGFQEDLLLERRPSCPPVLLHQDLNGGNLLCSDDGAGIWQLDAVIDWESAAVADPFSLSDEDPWRTARQFALVVMGSALAERYVQGTLPRCELGELVEGYERAARGMEEAGLLEYESWAARVARAQASAACG